MEVESKRYYRQNFSLIISPPTPKERKEKEKLNNPNLFFKKQPKLIKHIQFGSPIQETTAKFNNQIKNIRTLVLFNREMHFTMMIIMFFLLHKIVVLVLQTCPQIFLQILTTYMLAINIVGSFLDVWPHIHTRCYFLAQ